MLDRRLSLADWLQIPGNVEKYRDWVNNPITQDIVELVERSFRPAPVAGNVPGADLGAYCTYLHGEVIGANKCIVRMMHGDAFLHAEDAEVEITKGEIESLGQQGYSPSEVADRMNSGDSLDG